MLWTLLLSDRNFVVLKIKTKLPDPDVWTQQNEIFQIKTLYVQSFTEFCIVRLLLARIFGSE